MAHHISWRDVEGELVLFDTTTECYFALNGVASGVWREIARGRTVDAIVAELLQRYHSEGDELSRDVEAFVEGAIGRGLIVPAGR